MRKRTWEELEKYGPLLLKIAMLPEEEQDAYLLTLKKLIYAAKAGMDVPKYNAMSKEFRAYMTTDEMIRVCMPKGVKLFPYKGVNV